MPSRNYSKGIALIVPDERAEDAVALADERFGSDMKGAILSPVTSTWATGAHFRTGQSFAFLDLRIFLLR